MSDDEVAKLVAAGNLRGAAMLLAARGDHGGAAEKYADAWAFADASAEAEKAGRADLALRWALAADDAPLAARILATLLAGDVDTALAASRFAEARSRFGDAARLAEHAGDLPRAASLYERGGEHGEAGRLLEATGELRAAGRAYERRARDVPEDAPAQLALGRILARFGQHEAAARVLQKVATTPSVRGTALRLLVACLDALGMSDAAAARLDELRELDPSLPVTVPDYLEETFGARRGAEVLGGEEGAALLAGRYRVIRPLGAGATGRVVLARDVFFDRDVAVKALTVGEGTQGRDALVRFAREARIASSVEHASVVRVYDYDPAGPFLVMEHMQGGTLEERLAGGAPLQPKVARGIAVAILDALAAVHRRGVVHRDLKPANVFFDAAGGAKLGDFGTAHLADLGATLTGAMLGSLATMAPEQITGSRAPTAAVDLYALGVVLFRMLTGIPPFPGPDYVTQHLESPPPLVSEARPALGTGYDALVGELLTKDPDARPHDAADVKARLLALPFDDVEDASPGVVPVRAPDPAAIDDAQRYVDDGVRTHDLVLDRDVRLVPCDEAGAAAWRALARCAHPGIQAVWDVDPARGRVVLEAPQGEALTSLAAADPRRAAAIALVRAALDALHAAGLAHGEVDAAHVVVGAGRTVLLLPLARAAEATPDGDLEALARL